MKSNIYSRITSKILIAVLMLSCIAIVACTDGNNGLEYKVNSDGKTCTITGLGTYSSKDLVIPSHIGGYKVTAIADHAFQGTDIETFSGPDSITTIGRCAFKGCKQLKTAFLPDNITEISEFCFESCDNLYYIQLPQKLKHVGKSAFSLCTSLVEIELPEGVLTIEEKAFYWCERMTSINFPQSLQTIGEIAFGGCKSLQEVVLPDFLMTIGKGAFTLCYSLKEVHIPASVMLIGAFPFGHNNLIKITVDEYNTTLSSINGDLYYNNDRILINYACGKSLISFQIPEGVEELGSLSFSGSINLVDIFIPNTVKFIGSSIFWGANNIKLLHYEGTVNEWKNIFKPDNWNSNTESTFTIICTDGTIAMDGTVTYN